MTQTLVRVTYTLEDMLGQISQKLGRMDSKLEDLRNEVVEIKIGQAQLESELKGDIKSLEAEVKGIVNAWIRKSL